MMARAMAISGAATLGLAGCSGPDQGSGPPGFEVVEVIRIDENLVNILVETRGDGAAGNLLPYAECAVASYAQQRGFGFARQIRTNRSESGGIWRADAVYSITPALPRGARTLDTEIVVQDCAERGLPTG